MEVPQVMVRLLMTPIFIIPSQSSFPPSSMVLQWSISPLIRANSPQPMHGDSNTWNTFLKSLESHRNKPHSIQSLDAPEIISDIFALLLFLI